MTTPPASNPPIVYRDAEIVYAPHWDKFNGTSLEPLINSANGAFPKPIVEVMSIGIIHGIKWVNSYSNTEYKTQLNATNNATWRDWDAGQAWISRIITEDEEVNGVSCVKVHYIVRCNEFGWNTRIHDMGYFYIDGADKKAFLTVDDVPYIGLLDAGAETSTPVASDKQIKRRIDFTVLGF